VLLLPMPRAIGVDDADPHRAWWWLPLAILTMKASTIAWRSTRGFFGGTPPAEPLLSIRVPRSRPGHSDMV
jgi:hypothetical protein